MKASPARTDAPHKAADESPLFTELNDLLTLKPRRTTKNYQDHKPENGGLILAAGRNIPVSH